MYEYRNVEGQEFRNVLMQDSYDDNYDDNYDENYGKY